MQLANLEVYSRMYGLPKEAVLDFLTGCELEQISFTLYTLKLHFSHDLIITVDSYCTIVVDDETIGSWQGGELADLREFGELFGERITGYEIPGDGRLVINFGSRRSIQLFDTDASYESYQIIGGGQIIVV